MHLVLQPLGHLFGKQDREYSFLPRFDIRPIEMALRLARPRLAEA
jgi:hypothetical protein